jgi:phospholipid N-methyltransferase
MKGKTEMQTSTDYSATYSPEDNKLRLYSASKLPADVYEHAKAEGFRWAPKQELFVAPMWTPSREDFLTELCGEIGDEDTSLVERASERAERFADYSNSRKRDADRAHEAVAAIADHIPLGQPILIGHHSEKRARKDAERIETGMRRAVKMWEQSQYWQDRAKGAIRAAKYKERADVRARRIKTLEADKRKFERTRAHARACLELWHAPDKELTYERARAICNRYDHTSACFPVAQFPRLSPDASTYESFMSLWSALDGIITPEQARDIATRANERTTAHADRWIAHLENRIAYERAMLGEAGGTVADKTGPEKGGAVRCWASPGYGKGWSYIQKVNKVSASVLDNWGSGGGNFKRTIPFDKLNGVMTVTEVAEAREAGRLHETADGLGFYLDEPAETRDEAKDRVHCEAVERAETDREAEAAKFEALKGVKVETVAAPQLFPTPREIAERMADLAELEPGLCVLEPSAGTGNLVRAVLDRVDTEVLAYEINGALCNALTRNFPSYKLQARQADFLEVSDFQGCYPRVVMNPPFKNGEDIKHILHGFSMLAPGGRLVALCADGPRQREKLMPLADHWEELPAGTFAEQGTSVNVALLVMTKEAAPEVEATEQEPNTFDGEGFTLTHDRNWTWIKFTAKPSDTQIAAIKSRGARWSKRRNAWYVTKTLTAAELGLSSPLAGCDLAAEMAAIDEPEAFTVTCDICGREFEDESEEMARDMVEAHKMIAHYEPPTGTDAPNDDTRAEGAALAPALRVARETLQALKVIKDAENVRVKRDRCAFAVGDPHVVGLVVGESCVRLNADKIAKWCATFDAGAVFAVRLDAEGLTLTAGSSFVRFAAQTKQGLSFGFAAELVDAGGGLLQPVNLPETKGVQAARKSLADERKVERLRKEARKAHVEAARATRAAEVAKRGYAQAQEVLTTTNRAQVLADLLRRREAKRAVRALRLATEDPKTASLNSFHWLTAAQRETFAAYVAKCNEAMAHRTAYQPRKEGTHATYERRRRRERYEQALRNLQGAVEGFAMDAIAERLCSPAEREEWGSLAASRVLTLQSAASYRRARLTVRAYPKRRAELETASEEAQNAYLEAFDEYERAAQTRRAA